MFLDKEAIRYFNKVLNLPYTGLEQDWDLEMANYKRLDDFISFYNDNLSINQKKVLMSLILASFNDLLYEFAEYNDYWNRISSILSSEKEILQELFIHWGANDERKNNDSFKITPFLKSIRN